MHIGLLGPVTTSPLNRHLPDGHGLPEGMGGTPIVLLTDALLDAGHDVTLWSLSPDITEPVKTDGAHLRLRYLPWRHGGRGRDQYRDERRWLARALNAEVAQLDVLNPHWTYEYALAALAIPDRRRPPLLVTSHDWAPTILRYTPDPYRLMRLVMAMRVYARRPALTVPSPYLANAIRRGTGLRSMVVPNGLAVSQFDPGPRTITEVGSRVLCVSDGFGDRKNTSTLMRAIVDMRRAGATVTLTIVGNDHGPDEPAHRWAQANDVTDGVTFGGRVTYSQVLALMDTADVLAHPAREESFGMVLIEAMARGLPVVGGDRAGAVPWVLDDGNAGVLVDIDDPDALAAGILSVLDDPSRAAALSSQGYRHAVGRFTMPTIAAQYVEAYETVRHP